MTQTFKFQDSTINLITVYGVVASKKSESTTTYHERHSVLAHGNYLASQTSEETEFFLKRESKKELFVRFPTILPIREGHRVSVVYATANDDTYGAIGVYNHDLDKSYAMPLPSVLYRLDLKTQGDSTVTKYGCFPVLILILLFPIFIFIGLAETRWYWILLGCFALLAFAGALIIDPLRNEERVNRYTETLRVQLEKMIADIKDKSATELHAADTKLA
jgi:hypothetical protein